MGAVGGLQGAAGQIGASMAAVSRGNLGAASGALSAAATLPTPAAFGASLAGPGGGAAAGGAGPSAFSTASLQVGLNSLVRGALDRGKAELGDALGLEGAGGGGASAANAAGPEGAVAGNSASDSATGPGHAVNVCSSTHDEQVGSIKATIAAAGIHTTIKGARTQDIGAARVELVGGTRAESCLADKTEKAVGLVVLSKGPETENVGGSRSTMVGGAILEKIDGSSTVLATGKAMFVGAFHKVDASSAIVLKCGESEVVIDGGGIAIKAAAVTITAPDITLTKVTSEA
jgi:type VI secretion system secreted protein VgrG